MTAREMLAAFAAGTLSPVEAVERSLARIEERNGELRAFVALDAERARADARAAEAAWRSGRAGPLCGVPVGVKDLFDTEGVETAFGSPMFAGRVPAADAWAVRRLREAGAVIVGKTATHEFAWGITMRNATLGPTRNPWDPSRTPGGSSGGSAVAVAAGMVPLALGTDTGGSIRLPAALCGVVGHKPTHGAVRVDGAWPLAPSFDHVGPIAGTAEDAALMLGVLRSEPRGGRAEPAGGRPHGAEGAGAVRGSEGEGSGDGVAGAAGPAAAAGPGHRFGFALPMAVAPPVEAALRAVAGALGAVEVALPDALPAYAPLFGSEAVRGHRAAGLWPSRADEYDPTVRERMEIAERVTEADVAAARVAREEVGAEMDRLFERVDLILSPVCAWAPPPLLDDPVDFRPAVTPLVCLQNLLGLPACAFPAGRDPAGMPIGLQLTGPRGADAAVLAALPTLT